MGKARKAANALKEKLGAALDQVGAGSMFGLLATLLSLAIGGWASVFATEIRSSSVLTLRPGNSSFHGTVFLLLAAVVACVWWWRYESVKRQTDRDQKAITDAQNKLDDRAGDLDKLIRTRPPRPFLDNFAILFAYSDSQQRLVKHTDPDGQRRAIRDALQSLVGLAKEFDTVQPVLEHIAERSAHMNTIYAANVMLYCETQKLDEAMRDLLRQSVRFDSTAKEHLDAQGFLVLCSHLSARKPSQDELESDSDESAPPDALLAPRFALAVREPSRTKDEKLWKILPGAPACFSATTALLAKASEAIGLKAGQTNRAAVEEAIKSLAPNERHQKMAAWGDHWSQALLRMDRYEDVTALPSWCRKNGSFDHDDIEEMTAYFEEVSDSIRSMMSMPLFTTKGVVGVLNIHSSRPLLLQDNQQAGQFVAATTPFRQLIGRTLEEFDIAEEIRLTLSDSGSCEKPS